MLKVFPEKQAKGAKTKKLIHVPFHYLHNTYLYVAPYVLELACWRREAKHKENNFLFLENVTYKFSHESC